MAVRLLQQLPADVLLHVFSYLPAADKLRVRACCKCFERLASHRSLWRHHTARFSFKNGRYDPRFWASVARRGIRSAVVRGAKENHWRQLAVALPSLAALVVDTGVQSKCLDHLDKFPKLTRLSVRGAAEYHKKATPGDVTITGLRVADPRQMTHVGLCEVGFASPQHFAAFLSQFTNLTSLACHSAAAGAAAGRDQAEMFHCVVAGLPKLKHLSWVLNPRRPAYTVGVPEEKKTFPCSGETTPRTLSSLELVVYDDDDSSLSDDTLRSLSRLQSLTVVYVPPHRGRRLKTWLGLFRHLCALVVNEGPPPREYVRAVPATVTRLTLCGGAHIQGTSTDLAVVASRVPGLLHLQLDPWPTGLMLWKLFPALQSVKVRAWQIGEKNFLDFHRFPSLRRIEVVDEDEDDDDAAAESSRVAELSRRLLTLSGDRIRVMRSPRRRDPTACYHQVH
ncbi:hypothetical protein CRUP_002587 [Coryphaenoides rupestris]|nr:hypothetical protein CRUP_002587 [Coryphaenoides rupestris]